MSNGSLNKYKEGFRENLCLSTEKSDLYRENELTAKSPIASDIFLQDNLVRSIEVKPHWHDCFEILFVLKGNAIQTLNQKQFNVSKNDLIIIRKGDVHSTFCEPDNDVKIVVIKFLPSFIESIYSHSFESIYITSFLNINVSPIINLEDNIYLDKFKGIVSSLLDEFKIKDPSYEIAIKGYLSVLISLLVRVNLLVIPELLLKKDSSHSKTMSSLIKYIEDNALNENFNLKSMSRELNFNYSYCSRYFKNNTGKGFFEFLTFVRICEAEKKILNCNYSITKAAIESGFSSSSVFSKAYKNFKGYSPKYLLNQKNQA